MLNERNIPLEEDGIEEEILVDEEIAITKAMWGDIGGNIENQTDLQNALDAKQDSLTEAQLNAVNSGITAGKVATYDGYADQIASKADQSALNAEATTRGEADTALGRRIDNEALARQSADNGLQTQIDAITSKSDVVDVVANYAALQAYDTSTLGNNDVVKVLDDETHEDALTYYRWSTTTQTWSYIGQEAPYYSKGQMDVKLAEKQDKLIAGTNIHIAQDGKTISATDTTYTAGNGLNLNGTEFSADTDVLATKSDLDNYYTKTETDTKLAPKLETEVVAELPTTGEEGKLYLTPKAHTTQTATGNPITATVSEDAGAIESFQLDGDTFQQPNPNPDYPQPIQTVTGLQTVSINGTDYPISLSTTRELDMSQATRLDAYINGSGVIVSSEGDALFSIQVEPNATYTLTKAVSSRFRYVCTSTTPTIGANVGTTTNADSATSATITTGVSDTYLVCVYWSSNSTQTKDAIFNSVEITERKSIELCKLGTYQDYIYKDGEDWKVHKECGKVTVDSSYYSTRYGSNSYGITQFLINLSFESYFDSANFVNMLSNSFDKQFTSFANTQVQGFLPALDPSIHRLRAWIRINTATADTDVQFKTWLDNNRPIFYYKLDTPTDTEITDTELIAQLEAIRTASLENGANTITNTATGSNLAGDMEIGYYGYNPRNRYDKWLWLDINNEYEQIGS